MVEGHKKSWHKLEFNEEIKSMSDLMVSERNPSDLKEISDCVFHCFSLKSA